MRRAVKVCTRYTPLASRKSPPSQNLRRKDPATVKGGKDEQMYRDAFGAAMDAARVDALVFPLWTFPPKINGDRGQTPQGQLTFIGSATQWPVVVVPMGFVDENLPIGFQFFGALD